MGVGHLRRPRLSATLVLLAAGLIAACTDTGARSGDGGSGSGPAPNAAARSSSRDGAVRDA